MYGLQIIDRENNISTSIISFKEGNTPLTLVEYQPVPPELSTAAEIIGATLTETTNMMITSDEMKELQRLKMIQ